MTASAMRTENPRGPTHDPRPRRYTAASGRRSALPSDASIGRSALASESCEKSKAGVVNVSKRHAIDIACRNGPPITIVDHAEEPRRIRAAADHRAHVPDYSSCLRQRGGQVILGRQCTVTVAGPRSLALVEVEDRMPVIGVVERAVSRHRVARGAIALRATLVGNPVREHELRIVAARRIDPEDSAA